MTLPVLSRRSAVAGRLVFAALLTLISATPAGASPRARLSRDLIDHLAAGTAAIDVIVHGTQAEVEALSRRYNVPVRKRLRSGAVLRVTAGQLAALEQDRDVDHLSSDLLVRASDLVIGKPGAVDVVDGAQAQGPTGRGVGVAVIDSGIDRNHPALSGKVVYAVDFTGGDGRDLYGHGTQVAGLIAGRTGRTPATAQYRGVARDAHLVSLRVLDAQGRGSASDVVEAIDWAIEHRERFNIRVINLSLGGPVRQPYRDDPMCEAVARAVRAGIVVVASAGNFGRAPDGRAIVGGVTSPANSPYAIAVGAINTKGTAELNDDEVAPYNSRGPTMYDRLAKPDVLAPGHGLVAPTAAGGYLASRYPERQVGDDVRGGAYQQVSGTSMAAAVATAGICLLLDVNGRHPINAGGLVVELRATSRHHSTPTNDALVRGGTTDAATIVWGGFAARDTIVWGGFAEADTIVWGGFAEADTIVWGGFAEADTIVWGGFAEADTIVWGGFADTDTIVWGGFTDADIIR